MSETDWSVEAVREKFKATAPKVQDNMPKAFGVAEGQATHKTFRLEVFLTERFVKRAKKSKVVKREGFYQALSDLRFGYDPEKAEKGHEGRGLIMVPLHSKQDPDLAKKLYERFLFSVKGQELLKRFGMDHKKSQGVKAASGDVVLLGFLQCAKTQDQWLETLVLVDLEE